MASNRLTKPTSTSKTSPVSSMSRTLANALIPGRRNSSDERRIGRPGPVPYAYTPPNPGLSPNGIISRVGDGARNVQGVSRLLSDNEYHNELYYQAQIAHLQTALVREHSMFVRVTIGFSILVFVMLVIITLLFQRPTSCGTPGKGEIKWNVNIPILSPWTSTHEKERHATTTTAAGWNFTTVMLLTSIVILVWQNRNTMLKPLIGFITSHAGDLRYLLSR